MTVSPPLVSITAVPLVVGSQPEITITASDINAMTQVAVDVGLQGDSNFNGAGDLNQTVQTITLANNTPVTITLNAFPTPLLSSYSVEACVTDAQGDQGRSNTVTMRGPKPDTISLTVPTTLTATNNTAIVNISANRGNAYPSTVTLAIDRRYNGVFQNYASGNVSSSGVANIPLTGLAAGTYQVQATATDPTGNTLVSAIQTVTVATTPASSTPDTSSTTNSSGNSSTVPQALRVIHRPLNPATARFLQAHRSAPSLVRHPVTIAMPKHFLGHSTAEHHS